MSPVALPVRRATHRYALPDSSCQGQIRCCMTLRRKASERSSMAADGLDAAHGRDDASPRLPASSPWTPARRRPVLRQQLWPLGAAPPMLSSSHPVSPPFWLRRGLRRRRWR
ncbi:hypothetical protein BS78_05G219800 [Paspalum vaginatum]|nr:hypothetical protein BS78_05G219800 [Paspalum vaginatum]